MIEWYTNYYANFSGRATRIEYGVSLLVMLLLSVAIIFFSNLTSSYFLKAFLNPTTLAFFFIIPLSAVTVRRIRDLGYNGGFVFLNFIPYINFIFILCLLIVKGEEDRNAYGESPYNEEIIQV
jgi:uncharacterized membrane protein YhaH (DUF805 family)